MPWKYYRTRNLKSETGNLFPMAKYTGLKMKKKLLANRIGGLISLKVIVKMMSQFGKL